MTMEEKYTYETGEAPKACVLRGSSVAEEFWYYTDDFVEWHKEEESLGA